MRYHFLRSVISRTAPLLVVCGAMTLLASTARPASAQLNLAYSFETGLEGFAPNPQSIHTTLTQDVEGATLGTKSMKVVIATPGTFEGALGEAPPAVINNPPGVEIVRFDLTLTEVFPGAFVNAGVFVYGRTQNSSQEGLQAEFADFAPLGDLGVGTHQIDIELSEAIHPTQGVFGGFNDIFGLDPTDLVPTGFQIYINKSADFPWTGYIDNIRVGVAPPPVDADFDNDTDVDNVDLNIWKGAFGPSAVGDADGDLDSDGNDFLLWQRQLNGPGATAVPEPLSLTLAGCALLAGWAWRRRTN